ncbi:hypothetical protein NW768_007996 [Fusarium equiseti]|uniref:F-box protein n=1 Tax=Fusarium equiseti TaxID=61235 RepID=A0ABQ8R5J3_FUSEQ|nr:hypothetical protein NW768_007996 [Fusarium equiseti]
MPSIWGTDRSNILVQLVHGEIFSHINSFSVRFDPSKFDLDGCWFGDGGSWGGSESIFVFRDIEDDEEMEEDEDIEDDGDMEGAGLMLHFQRMHIWRAQYNEVFVDLSMNPNITKLRFVDLLPKRASIWYSGQWDSMLQRLTHFDVSIFGAESGGWHGNATPGFVDFIDEFPIFIARYLENVKHLRLAASSLSVFGTDVDNSGLAAFPLHAPTPALHSLELQNIVISIEVIDYLRKPGTLRELTLHNCMCQTSEEDSYVQWSQIWGTVSEYCKAMQRVTFLQDETPPLDDFEYTRASRIAKRMVKKNKDLIVWRYVKIDQWGTVSEDGEANIQEVKTGHAYSKYCNLQKTLMERREQST